MDWECRMGGGCTVGEERERKRGVVEEREREIGGRRGEREREIGGRGERRAWW